MATNLYAPNGLAYSNQRVGGATTFQQNRYYIKNGYASSIGMGDLVQMGTGGNQGFIIIGAQAASASLGVFGGVLPYYDSVLQGVGHGTNGAYSSTLSPPAGVNIPCVVADDPFATFLAQVSGGPYVQTWQGQNINWLTGTNGAPNISGRSVLALDGASVAADPSLPFQIVDVAGLSGGPQDPANTNPWILVRLNRAQILSQTGI